MPRAELLYSCRRTAASRPSNLLPPAVSPLHPTPLQGIHKAVLREFLNPRHWAPSSARDFFFNYDQICQLCDQAERIFQQEPSVLKLRGGCRWGRLGGDSWGLGRLCVGSRAGR